MGILQRTVFEVCIVLRGMYRYVGAGYIRFYFYYLFNIGVKQGDRILPGFDFMSDIV